MKTQKKVTHTPTPPCSHEVPDYDETCRECEREFLMFDRITEKTNFAELIERPEWGGIKNRIVRAVNSHEALLEAVKDALCELDPDCKYDGSNYNGEPSEKGNSRIQTILALYKIINQAEGK